ncbi:MAG: hypothetical protein COB93_07465 [Sneathiella sp.]|nr:MAG: hypothetical protein COB93_07465 [Sneathiella sp.]
MNSLRKLTLGLTLGLSGLVASTANAVEIEYWQYINAGRVDAINILIEKFEAARWRLILGTGRLNKDKLPLTCDQYGCIYQRQGLNIAFPQNEPGATEDCGRADIILSRVPIGGDCTGAILTIDKFDLWRNGAHSLYFDSDMGVRFETANGLRGNRPWVPARHQKSGQNAD